MRSPRIRIRSTAAYRPRAERIVPVVDRIALGEQLLSERHYLRDPEWPAHEVAQPEQRSATAASGMELMSTTGTPSMAGSRAMARSTSAPSITGIM
jgi:hypothetical protein